MSIKLQRDIEGDGPLGEVLVVGNHPYEQDYDKRLAFSSASSYVFRHWCAEVGLKTRFEYVVQHQVIEKSYLWKDKQEQLPTPELAAWIEDLKDRIRSIKPKLIIVTGEVALKALTNYTNLLAVHCYVLKYGSIPVIPVLNPKRMFERRENARWIQFGIGKAAEVLAGEVDKPMQYDVSNNVDLAIKQLQAVSGETSIDIETRVMRKYGDPVVIKAISFSTSPDRAVALSKVDSGFDRFMGAMKEVLEDSSVLKIGQNFIFDAMILWKLYGIETRGPVWDTMHCHNILYSDLKNSLAEQGRLYFYSTPWKGGWKFTGEQLRLYNAQDVIVTHRIKERQVTKLKKEELYDYFTATPMACWEPAFVLARTGLPLDEARRAELKEKAETFMKEPTQIVQEIAKPYLSMGEKKKKKRDPERDMLVSNITLPFEDPEKVKRKELDMHLQTFGIPKKEAKEYYVAKKKDEKHGLKRGCLYRKAYKTEVELYKRDFLPTSSSQVMDVLVNAGVKIPKSKQQHTKKWAPSTNNKALLKIMERKDENSEIKEFVKNIIVLREGNKLVSSYLNAPIDADGRWRCTYNIEGTETGRSSTQKTPWKTGGNIQNIPRDGFQGLKFKKCFVAEPGTVLFNTDQSGAEARIVAYLARCKRLIQIIEAGEDTHLHTLAAIYNEPYETLVKSDPRRQKIKPVAHGANYGMSKFTLVETMLQGGTDITMDEAEFLMEKYHGLYPEIRQWHAETQQQVRDYKTLTTPFGRRRLFIGKIDENTFREAYAHVPQSMIPHITNLMWLWVFQHEGFKAGRVKVLAHVHDSLLMQIEEKFAEQFIPEFLNHAKTIQFKIHEYNINIPWDAEIGYNWGELQAWKP